MLVERVTTPRGLAEFAAAGPRPELTLRRLDAQVEPFWRHATRELFVLRDGRRVVGRIAAVMDASFDAAHAPGVGFFGWMQAPDDADAARALIEAASQWLRERGCQVMRGPLHLGLGEEQGALIEGFQPAPGPLLPDNQPHLATLLGKLGARVAHERHGYAWSSEEVPPPPGSLRARSTGPGPGGVVYRTLDPAHHGAEALRFLAMYNAANAGRWGFVPITEDEARARVRDVLAFGDPRLLWLAEVRGEPAGVVIALPVLPGGEIATREPGRRMAALRALRSAVAGARVERAHLVTISVDPRWKGLHLGAQLLLRAWRSALDLGVREAELSGVDAGDEAMNHLLWRLGCRRVRRYGMFELALR